MKNIYQLYRANGNKAGFVVRRQSWPVAVAIIKSIGGKEKGVLPGYPPYHGNPRVVAEVVSGGRVVVCELTCAGCFQWERVWL